MSPAWVTTTEDGPPCDSNEEYNATSIAVMLRKNQ